MRLDSIKAAGLSGLVLLILSALIYAVRGLADQYTWIPLGLGVLGVATWLSRDWKDALQMVTSRKTRYGANAVVLTVAVMALFGFAQAIIGNHSTSWDLTKNKVNTLSDQTNKTVKNLGQDVLLYHFNLGNNVAAYEDFLKKIRALNPSRFKYEMVDLNKRPLLAQTYSVRSSGTSVLVVGDRHESFTGTAEEDLVNALLKVTSTGTKVIYSLTGHQEVAMDQGEGGGSGFKRALENGAFLLKSVNLATTDGVPNDAAALVIAGPKVDLLPVEVERVKSYLARGGRVLMALDPRVQAPNLKALAKEAGVVFETDLVVDPLAVLMGAQPIMPPAGDFDPNHPVTKDLEGGQIVLPVTSSLSEASPAPQGAASTVLARSTGNSWAYTGTANNIPNRPGPNDKRGPVALALAVELPAKTFAKEGESDGGSARFVALGTSRLIGNEGFGYLNNADFVLNSVRWLSGEEKKIAIAPKDPENTPITMTAAEYRTVAIASLFVLPGLALLAGIVVHVRRRRALA